MSTPNQTTKAQKGKGVRKLTVADQLPRCEILINQAAFKLEDFVAGKHVIDIGCGYGRTRSVVEQLGGRWDGVEPFEGGAHTLTGAAESIPVGDASYDVVIMNAVLEHVLNPPKAFSEVARVLKPGGVFIGYVAFMECFHEVSYSHLSFKALEYFSEINGMKLTTIGGGGSFGIDYHLRVLFYPMPFAIIRELIAASIRGVFNVKSICTIPWLIVRRGMSLAAARELAKSYYKLQCLRQSAGFDFVIRKL